MTVTIHGVEGSKGSNGAPSDLKSDELSRRKQIVDIANRMGQAASLAPQQLRSAFADRDSRLGMAEQKGRQAIAQQAAQGFAAGAGGGLRANVAGANDAAQNAMGARAGFEAQMGQLRADNQLQQAQMVIPAQLDALRQEMLGVEKAQEMQATQEGQDARAGVEVSNWLSENSQNILETDNAYASRAVQSLLAQGLIPNTPEAIQAAREQVLAHKQGTIF